MARMSKSSVCMVVMATALVAAWVVPRGEALGCNDVAKTLNACRPYLTNTGPLGGCCSGVRSLNSLAKTQADRQSACSCLKSLAGSIRVDPSKARGLPGICGVTIPYSINPSIDCSKVQ